MGKHILPWVLLIVAIVVRLILAAPSTSSDVSEINSVRDPSADYHLSYSIFDSVATRSCRKKCHRRDHLNRCRLNFSCLLRG
ncbi:uncharacterized protein [Macrobrachium rosenbergii]|uniref:uncharacterized protein n=1 Tax=Macrobrachium rosenbergii TaxID=79674 RepID=UPI0034D6EE6B